MRTMIIAVAIALLVSPACVSTHMKRFIGKDVRYVEVDDGPPTHVFDLPGDVRAFQYRVGGGRIVIPTTSTTNGQIQLIGNSAYYTEQKVEQGGFAVDSPGCLVTYLAKWNADAQGWIVTSISYPKRLAC